MQMPVCPSCGHESRVQSRRCVACGARLQASTSSPELRKFVTVVTSDLKGSTALGERLDPESLREVLGRYFDEMRLVFESHGGTIEKIIGDAIVAVFGLPVARDDDALRATEAAAESQLVLATLNDQLETRWGVRLVNRTGVCSGEVVVGEEEGGQHVLTGPAVLIAGVMEQNAPPLEVLLDASTFGLVRGSVTAEPFGRVTTKSGDQSFVAFRLEAVAARVRADAAAQAVPAGPGQCPRCGEPSEPADRFCGMCGTNLVVAKPARESRKTVTLVFADPKPASVGGAAPTPEALREVMSRYFEAMRRALDRHGATVEKFIGDAVMAVFGLPVRHEDDAIRAIRAAAEMQAALPALNDELRAGWGIEIRNHIGVNTGEVIAGDASLGQRLVTGDAVNTAARLEQAAGPGEVILGELTYRLARDQIDAESIPPLSLKGKAEPVPAFRLIGIRRPGTEQVGLSTPFVGREAEMVRLEEALDHVSSARSCRLLTVIGDAGVGKSRMVREFAARAADRERSQVLRGRCLPYGDGVTFWPIAEIVRNAAGITDEDPRDVALAKIAAIARDASGGVDDPTPVIDRVGAAIGLSDTQFPGPELFWGIRKLLEAIAGRRPLVAIVDDVHVAASTFLELLDHLVEAVTSAPILLLATARRELFETRTEWAEAHEAEQIVLEPLSPDDSQAMVSKLLGGLEPSVRRRVVEAAEGNPLYLEQITAMLVETGAIRRDGGSWLATSSSSAIEIPPTVQALVAARLDALRDEERGVIDPASVIGLGFAVEAVSHLLPPEPVLEVPQQLRTLTAKQLVRPTAEADDFYRFGHAVIRDTAYRSLLKRTRAELHVQFVDWAEPVNRERGRELEFEEILGYHLEQAYRYRGELGPIDDATRELGERASRKLGSAGRRAFGRGDAPAASSLLRRAGGTLPRLATDRIELLTEAAEADLEQGEFGAARAALDEAKVGSSTTGDRRLQARQALVQLQLNHMTTGSIGDPVQVARKVRRMIPTFEVARDAPGLARAWRQLWVIYGTTGALERAADAASRVVEIASQSGDTRLAARAAVAYAQAALESPMPVLQAIERCEGLMGAVGLDRIAAARFLAIRSVLHAMRGEFATARRMYRQSHEIMAEVGTSVTASGASLESSRVEMLAGDPEAAERELRRDLATLERIDERYYRSSVAGLLAHTLYALGRPDEAVRYSNTAEQLAGEDDVFSQVIWRTARAKILAQYGQAEPAVGLARDAVALARGGSYIEQLAEALADLAEVHRALGEDRAQEPPLREALALFETKGDVVSSGRVRERLGRLEALELSS